MVKMRLMSRLDMGAVTDYELASLTRMTGFVSARMTDGAEVGVRYTRRGDAVQMVAADGHQLFEAKNFGRAIGTDVIDRLAVNGDLSALFAAALTGNDHIAGSHENDTVRGFGGDDVVRGESGHDLLFGDAGNDRIIAGSGDDRVYGGDGADLLQGAAGNDHLDGGTGVDTAYFNTRGMMKVDLALTGWQRTGAGLDRLAGVENLVGGAGADRFAGDAQDNMLNGAGGNDILSGRDGADVLVGGLGNDLLAGGAGADLFVFATGGGADTVSDFAVGEDRVRIAAGAADFADLVLSDGAGGAVIAWGDATITLTGVSAASLSAADFVFG